MAEQTDTAQALRVLIQALWDSANTFTGLVGLTVFQVLYLLGAVIGTVMMWHLGRQLLRKQTWTLDPDDTPVAYVRYERPAAE